MRILHAPTNIASQASYAADALRAAGHEVEVWEFTPSPFGFPSDRVIDKDLPPGETWRLFVEAVERFDVFHFHFAGSLFRLRSGLPPYWDLPVLRMLGKKVFHTFHGSDCRLRRVHVERNPWSYLRDEHDHDDDRIAKQVHTIRTYSDTMFVTALDYLDFVPDAEWLPRMIDLEQWPEQQPTAHDIPRIVHVPSRRGTKGTDEILAGLKELEATGARFELRLLEDVPHEHAQREIQSADIVIDNLITGDYELVSLESMASGRVAVANVAERVTKRLPDHPMYVVDPNTFVTRMRALLADRALQADLASRGRAFVAAHHDSRVLVSRLLPFYEAEPRGLPRGSFPDWLSVAGARKVEELEAKLATLTTDAQRLAAERRALADRNTTLRARVDALEAGRRTWKDLIPRDLRNRLARLRAQRRDRG